MKTKLLSKGLIASLVACALQFTDAVAQTPNTLAFPTAEGFGRFTTGARGAAKPEIYIVNNLNDSGSGSFRDACSKPGRFILFSVGGIIKLSSDIVVPANTTIAGQTAPGDGVVLFGKRVTFSGANNTIARYLRIRLGATDNSGKDASGIANGANMIFDHMSVTWGMDEVFSINWDNKGNNPDNITIQNSILSQGLHRSNHSAGGLIQPSTGGKISLIKNLYSSNKTRNPKVKGINEFVNNVVYNWGNYGNTYGHTESGDAYIMGGDSAGESFVNIINNYFISGPSTRNNLVTPFNRGNANFNLHASGNFFDNNKDGVLNGSEVPYDLTGYPTGDLSSLKAEAYDYPTKQPILSAEQAFNYVADNVGANYPRRDEVDGKLVSDLRTIGTTGIYLYRETDLGFVNGGLGNVFSAPAPLDTDGDGMPDAWEDGNGLDKNNKADALQYSTVYPEYLNIEVYINSITNVQAADFIKNPTNLTVTSISNELPSPNSEVTLNWLDNSNNEDSFVVERSIDGTNYSVITTTGNDIITFKDLTALPNTLYYYRVKAVNSEEVSAYSNVVTHTTQPIPTAPTKTSVPQPKNNYQYIDLRTGTSTTLKWIGSANSLTYKIYLGTDVNNLTEINTASYVASPSFTVNNLTAGTTYFWRVDALNDKGLATGDIWSFRTMPSIPNTLVGHWSFDDVLTNGTEVLDLTSFENHGSLGLDNDNSSIKIVGKKGNALDFATAKDDIYVVNIPNQDEIFLGDRSFTLSFWMKAPASMLPQDNNTSAYLLCKGSISKNATTGATGNRFNIEFKNKQFRFAIDNDELGKDELAISGTPFFTNEWVHVTVIRDYETQKLKAFLNGVSVGEHNITKAISAIGEASALVIGNIGELEFLAATNAPAAYKGMLDELKVYNYARTPLQIMEEYHDSPLPLITSNPSPVNAGETTVPKSVTATWSGGLNTVSYNVYLGTSSNNLALVANYPVATSSHLFSNLIPNTTFFWRVDAVGTEETVTGNVWSFTTAPAQENVANLKLDATSGTLIVDNSRFANNGELKNIATHVWESAKFNNGLNLTTASSNTSIEIPHQEHLAFNKSSFTISFWMKATKPSSSSQSIYLFNKGTFAKNATTGATGKWYGLELKNDKIYFSVDDDVNKTSAEAASTTILTNNWVHITCVRNVADKTLKMYINGTQLVSITENATSLSNGIGGTEPLYFANSSGLNAPFSGSLDEINFYNYALTPSEISQLSAQATLPVELIAFNAKQETNKVLLQWVTASEKNNSHFIVNKSIDGKVFSKLTEIKAVGNAKVINNYTFLDSSPFTGTNYYQLVQIDNNGTETVLDIKHVNFKDVFKASELVVYPNPTTKFINVKGFSGVNEEVKFILTSITGKTVFSKTQNVNQSEVQLDVLNKPAAGIYFLEIQSKIDTKVIKLVFQ